MLNVQDQFTEFPEIHGVELQDMYSGNTFNRELIQKTKSIW